MEELRHNILESAKALFLDIGYKHTSLEMVAEEAKVDEAAIRALFQDKKGLVKELLVEISNPYMSSIDFVCEDETDVRQFIRKSMAQLNRILIDNPDYVTLFHHLMHDDPEVMVSLMSTFFFPMDFYKRLQHFQESGEIKIKDPMVLESILDSILFFPHLSRQLLENFLGVEEMENYFDNLLESAMVLFENGLYNK